MVDRIFREHHWITEDDFKEHTESTNKVYRECIC